MEKILFIGLCGEKVFRLRKLDMSLARESYVFSCTSGKKGLFLFNKMSHKDIFA